MPQELFPNPHGVLTFKRKTQTKSVECWLSNQSVGWFKPDVDSVLNLQVPLQKNLDEMFLSVCSTSSSFANNKAIKIHVYAKEQT